MSLESNIIFPNSRSSHDEYGILFIHHSRSVGAPRVSQYIFSQETTCGRVLVPAWGLRTRGRDVEGEKEREAGTSSRVRERRVSREIAPKEGTSF